MKSSLLLIFITILLIACGADTKSSNTGTFIQLNKAGAIYLAYKISNEQWVEVDKEIEVTIDNEQTLTLATICIDNDSESYSSHAEIHNSVSLAENNIAIYTPQCVVYSGQKAEGASITISSLQEEIAIGAVSTKNIVNVQSAVQDFSLTIPMQDTFDIAVLGISQEEDIYIYKSPDSTASDSSNIIIDFYSDHSIKVTEFQEIPLNNWDSIEPYYGIDSIWIPLFNHWHTGNENPLPKQFISIPEELIKENGRYYSYLSNNTNITNYFLEARVSNSDSPKIVALPDDLSSLNNINIDYFESSEHYTLSIQGDISSIIPLPLDNFSIERSSSHRYDPYNPNPPYWDKIQKTTSYLKNKDNTISLIPIEFHLLPDSPIEELFIEDINSISSNITFLIRDNNEKPDFYKLYRNLKELLDN